MRKVNLFLVSFLTLLPLGVKADPGDVIFLEISKEADPEEIPRSSTVDIEGCYYVETGLLELSFNVNLGSVAVEVTDQYSNTIGFTNLSTTPGVIFLPVITGSGTFTVSIETSSGDCYSGCFIL